jgi:CRP/FNR family transcriptional regulator
VGPHKRRDFCGALLDRSFVACQHHRTANPGERIVSSDEVSEDVFLLCKGWGYRFFVLPNGRRQIFNFLLPGDLFPLTSISEERFSFSVDALTEVHILGFRRAEIKRRLALNSSLRLKWTVGVAREARTADELLVVLGQRTAEERVGYLMLHLTRRMSALGLADKNRYRFPVKQAHIADMLGITSECVCRMLSRFRKRGILDLSNGYLDVLDFVELERIGSPKNWT